MICCLNAVYHLDVSSLIGQIVHEIVTVPSFDEASLLFLGTSSYPVYLLLFVAKIKLQKYCYQQWKNHFQKQTSGHTFPSKLYIIKPILYFDYFYPLNFIIIYLNIKNLVFYIFYISCNYTTYVVYIKQSSFGIYFQYLHCYLVHVLCDYEIPGSFKAIF